MKCLNNNITFPVHIKSRKWSGPMTSMIANLLPKEEDGWLTLGVDRISLCIFSRDGCGVLLGVDCLDFFQPEVTFPDDLTLQVSGLPTGTINVVPIEFQGGQNLCCIATIHIPPAKKAIVHQYFSAAKRRYA